MKVVCTLFISLLYFLAANAQKLEINLGVNGTLCSFRGEGAASNTSLYATSGSGELSSSSGGFYGTKAGLGWSAEATAQRVWGKSKFLAGISVSMDVLSSKIDLIDGTTGAANKVVGSARLSHVFLNLYPNFGRRFFVKKQNIDLNAGFEFAVPLSAQVILKNNSSSGKGKIAQHKPDIDLRPRLQVKWQYKKIGALLSYAIGFYNYYGFLSGGKYQAYSNVTRLGIFYRL